MITLEFLIIILCLLIGTRYGGMGLGLIAGIGLFILIFIFRLPPGSPPVGVMLTILAVIGCASVLQVAGGLGVMMQYAERLLRRHPKYITLLAPLTTWSLTFLCGTGHVVYTMFPIIYDIALNKGIRPERPMAAASVASQMGIGASPVSVAVVSMISVLATAHDPEHSWNILQILSISAPASLFGVFITALWSFRRGKDLKEDKEFQAKINDPKQREFVYGSSETLLKKAFPREAYIATSIFFAGILAVVLFGSVPFLRPSFSNVKNIVEPLSMNLVIQIVMLVSGAWILIFCKVKPATISSSEVFKAGMTAIFSVFAIAWMSDTFFDAHIDWLKQTLENLVKGYPWTYGIALFIVSKLVNSQAAAFTAMAPIALSLGLAPKMIMAFIPAIYGYFILPTYPSDLACIGFDRSGTTRIGRFVINHSFILPGLIGVSSATVASYTIVRLFF